MPQSTFQMSLQISLHKTQYRFRDSFFLIVKNPRANQKLRIYFIGHNKPINGFLPAATHPSNCLCFLRTYANRRQSFPDLVFPTDTRSFSSPTSADPRKFPHQIPFWTDRLPTWPSQHSRWILIRCTTSMFLRSPYSSLLNWMRKLRRSYVGLFSRILSRLLHQCLIGLMPLPHKEARIGWASCRALVLSYEVSVTQ